MRDVSRPVFSAALPRRKAVINGFLPLSSPGLPSAGPGLQVTGLTVLGELLAIAAKVSIACLPVACGARAGSRRGGEML